MDNKNSGTLQTQQQQQPHPQTAIEHGRFGDIASVCKSIAEACVTCYIIVWLVVLFGYAVGFINLALFLINLGTIVVALFSIVALNGIHDTYLTFIFVIMAAVTFAISTTFSLLTGFSALSCAASGTMCPPAPDTYITYATAAVASLVLAVLSLIITLASYRLLEIYEESDRENKRKRS